MSIYDVAFIFCIILIIGMSFFNMLLRDAAKKLRDEAKRDREEVKKAEKRIAGIIALPTPRIPTRAMTVDSLVSEIKRNISLLSVPGASAPVPKPAIPEKFRAEKYKRYTKVIAYTEEGLMLFERHDEGSPETGPGYIIREPFYVIQNSKPEYGRIVNDTLGAGALATLVITPSLDKVVMIVPDGFGGVMFHKRRLRDTGDLVSVVKTVYVLGGHDSYEVEKFTQWMNARTAVEYAIAEVPVAEVAAE
jgi:hypothetical protein